MKLTLNSWHYKFWMLNYSKYEEGPNNNFCDYFWSLLFAVVILPFTWIGLITNKIWDNGFTMWPSVALTLTTYLVLFLIGGFGVIIYRDPITFSVVGGVIGGMFLILYLLYKFIVWFFFLSSVTGNIKEIGAIAGEGIKSFKGKYCPQIFWDGKKETTFLGEERPTTLNEN